MQLLKNMHFKRGGDMSTSESQEKFNLKFSGDLLLDNGQQFNVKAKALTISNFSPFHNPFQLIQTFLLP